MYERARRTAYCEVWDEKFGPSVEGPDAGEARLVLQYVRVYESDDDRQIRAVYERNGRIHARPPNFAPNDWVEVLAQAIRDPDWIPDHLLEPLAAAIRARAARHIAR